jgi:hypothetical protein
MSVQARQAVEQGPGVGSGALVFLSNVQALPFPHCGASMPTAEMSLGKYTPASASQPLPCTASPHPQLSLSCLLCLEQDMLVMNSVEPWGLHVVLWLELWPPKRYVCVLLPRGLL